MSMLSIDTHVRAPCLQPAVSPTSSRQTQAAARSAGWKPGLEFEHLPRASIVNGLNHSAQGCAPSATLGGWCGIKSTLKGLHRNRRRRYWAEKTAWTRTMANDCGMDARMERSG